MKKKRLPINVIFKIMKFSFVQLLFIALSLSALKANHVNAQEILDKKISIDLNKVSMKKALSKIEKKGAIYFTYRPQLIKDLGDVSLKLEEERLENILTKLLTPFAIQFKVYSNSNVVLSPSPGLATSIEQDEEIFTITGQVTDDSGEGLIGANVLLKGTNAGTITDFDGNYTLDVPDNAKTLVFSYTGYTDKEVEINGQRTINVTLSEGLDLESVTVVGSRGKPRTQLETAVPVDVIGAKTIANSPQPELSQVLQFAAPSFHSTKQNIGHGSDHIDPIALRGLGADQTLVLINGKRRHASSLMNVNGTVARGQVGTDLNAIPMAAVERIEVLRDGAAAQYGSDAIAGVINIVLKKNINKGEIKVRTGFLAKPPTISDAENALITNPYADIPGLDQPTQNASYSVWISWCRILCKG